MTDNLVRYLQSPQAIRDRCHLLFQFVEEGRSPYFRYHRDRLDEVADFVISVTKESYPDLDIPFHSRWQHFEVGHVFRLQELDNAIAPYSPREQTKIKFDLAIVSVLVDAGAGSRWQYREVETGRIFQRSEGLAVASFRMFQKGLFSSDRDRPLQVDAAGLKNLTLQTLAKGFQVNETNPLVGLTGRLQLLQTLGAVLVKQPQFFGEHSPRSGNLVDYLLKKVAGNNTLTAPIVLQAILASIGEIWPGRFSLKGLNLGDVWQHEAIGGDRFVPFHKLSQWLTYSLLEPLEDLGIKIHDLEQLTGLAEYRNGGLFLDFGVLEIKQSELLAQSHLPSSKLIIEWRALTVILLDRIAEKMRQKLTLTSAELPLIKVLQGGTWMAGRKIASKLRSQGNPPLSLQSDGTVF
ncbi:MAG: URC4/urg3 family protein [Cyanobacteria bacterium SBLK]|nr:URC4/urg3 family protein [Cyanobacteria bacterium SBLK]